VTGSASAVIHRDLIITLAAQHKLPAVYFQRHFVAARGLISYGADLIDEYRRAAAYVDRILKGENPADLPVQAPKPQPVGFLQRSAFIFLRPQSRLLSAH
jgi:putative ABC transport system substrate-binding protein